MVEQPKELKTGVMSTLSGTELVVRATPVGNEVGIIDDGQKVAIYWKIHVLEKMLKSLKEVVE
jgi:hypothetical protein